ncbi:MAG: hypothetical protein R3F59_01480 [Myxococcota bacterium]
MSSITEPMAMTVTGELPLMAANSAQAATAPTPRPPGSHPRLARATSMRQRRSNRGHQVPGEHEERDGEELDLLRRLEHV